MVKIWNKMFCSDGTVTNIEFQNLQDPIAHRLIEKKRRDRFNTQLERLKSLLPLDMNRKVMSSLLYQMLKLYYSDNRVK
jgi:hypothetical protein